METVQFKSIETEEEILSLLEYFTPYFKTLESGVIDKKVYANKILNQGKVIIIEVNGVLAGFATFYCNDNKNHKAYLSFIAISNQYKHKGFGKMLMNKVKEISLDNGMTSMELEVRRENIGAIAFYNREKFERICKESDTDYSIKLISLL